MCYGAYDGCILCIRVWRAGGTLQNIACLALTLASAVVDVALLIREVGVCWPFECSLWVTVNGIAMFIIGDVWNLRDSGGGALQDGQALRSVG